MCYAHLLIAVCIATAFVPHVVAAECRNLDFEEGTPGYFDDAARLFPHWEVNPKSLAIWDTICLDSSCASLHGLRSTGLSRPLEGGFSAVLQHGVDRSGLSEEQAWLRQTCDVPVWAQSLRWRTIRGAETWNGFDEIAVLGSATLAERTGDIILVGIDLTGFQGQPLTIEFIARPSRYTPWIVDAVEFSPYPVPEPAAWGLALMGGVALWGVAIGRSIQGVRVRASISAIQEGGLGSQFRWMTPYSSQGLVVQHCNRG